MAHCFPFSFRLTKELLEKNNLIQSLQSQSRTKSPRSHHSSHSDLLHSDRTFSSGQSPRSGTRPQSKHLHVVMCLYKLCDCVKLRPIIATVYVTGYYGATLETIS